MLMITLCYHDVLPEHGPGSGFNTTGADTYKISLDLFRGHLRAALRHQGQSDVPRFTFDDGGIGAMCAADALEEAGVRGWFFIPTALIGKAGFLCARQIAELSARGHIVGSHGTTHCGRMNRMPDDVLRCEWEESVQVLADITGSAVDTGSVPSGFYARRVAEAAAAAGIRQLYTLRPTRRVLEECGCEILGRFTVRAWTPPSRVAAIARGAQLTHLSEAVSWRIRQLVKTLAGSAYGDLRRL